MVHRDGRFTDNGDGTVTDKNTGLMWQQRDDNVERTWNEAMAYCEDLELAGHTDWRLPDKDELMSIVDKSRENPAINTDFFPGTRSSSYWSSSTHVDCAGDAWDVHFHGGRVGYGSKAYGTYVRCVR